MTAFIDEHRAEYGVEPICRVLPIAPSTYHERVAQRRDSGRLASRTDAFSTTGVRDSNGRSGNFAGHQIEARVRYWIVPSRLRFEFDGLLLAKGRFLTEAPNAPTAKLTHYISFNLAASF